MLIPKDLHPTTKHPCYHRGSSNFEIQSNTTTTSQVKLHCQTWKPTMTFRFLKFSDQRFDLLMTNFKDRSNIIQ